MLIKVIDYIKSKRYCFLLERKVRKEMDIVGVTKHAADNA